MRREEERGDHTKMSIERSESNTRLIRELNMKDHITQSNEEDEESRDIQVD